MWKFGKKSMEDQMKQYMELYYPTSGPFTYEIMFDWSQYTITTEAKLEEEVHDDSRPYRGHITMRPAVVASHPEIHPPMYLITPQGEVWKNDALDSVPEIKTRQEVTERKSDHGTTVQTLTIQSVSEPVIDHFGENPSQWTRYGTIERSGSKSHLKRIEG